MAQGTWSLRDSPIFWFTASSGPPPGKTAGVYTSYTYGFNWVPIEGGPTPEVAAKIAKGDHRYMNQE